MKIVRKQGFCSCRFKRKVVKDESSFSSRYYYQDEPRSILINCISCGQKIKKSFIPVLPSDKQSNE
ncbi:MAG: hypothetical protein ISP71_01125 [Flavobacteriales bacterium]|nr:hypothetical protein [Flavobacteriales bacterium]